MSFGSTRTGKMARSGVTIDVSTFERRLQSLYSHWRQHRDELWGSCNAFAVAIRPFSDGPRYVKSSALSRWLFGYESADTIMVFSDKQMHFLCSPKKLWRLDVVKKSAKEAVGVDVVMHVKSRYDDGATQMDAIIRAIERSNDAPLLGYLAREAQAPGGPLLQKWTEKLSSSSLQLRDIANGLADVFAVKEPGELTKVKMAAYVAASAMEHFVVPKLEKVIEKEEKVTHSSLADDTWKAFMVPASIKVEVKAHDMGLCCPPIFQSGGNFDLRPSAPSNSNGDHLLDYGSASVIICALGSQYKTYCANVARTFLIDPDAAQSMAYEVLIKAHEAALGAVKPGNKARDVYEAAHAVVEEEAPGLTANLTKSAGAVIGHRVLVCESGLILDERNERILEEGMVFNVSLGFENMQTENQKKYALMLADTVILTANGHEVVTASSPKALKDVLGKKTGSAPTSKERKDDGQKQPITSSKETADRFTRTGKMARSGVTIDVSTFERRLQSLYSHWRQHRDELWGSCNAFAVAIRPFSDGPRYVKSSALSRWLLGYESADTIMVFSDKQMHFLCSPKKLWRLDVVKKSAKEAVGVDIVMHVKSRYDDGATQMDAIIRAIERSNDAPLLGYLAREAQAPGGPLLQKWTEKLSSSSLQLRDIANGLADVFAVKEPGELTKVKMAAYVAASAMEHFVVPKLEKVIEKEEKVTHSSLADDTWKAFMVPASIKVEVKAHDMGLCCPPIFQSGGNFDLRPSAPSNSNGDHLLDYGSASVIICALGSQYKTYCANVARTFLIDPDAAQSMAYEVLIKAHEAALGAVKRGNKARDVYEAAHAVVEEEAPGLTANFTKSAGAVIGHRVLVLVRESGLILDEGNERILEEGMVFNVSLGFENMQTESQKKYALLLADTVILTANGHEIVTASSPKALEDVLLADTVILTANGREVVAASSPKALEDVLGTKTGSVAHTSKKRKLNHEMVYTV